MKIRSIFFSVCLLSTFCFGDVFSLDNSLSNQSNISVKNNESKSFEEVDPKESKAGISQSSTHRSENKAHNMLKQLENINKGIEAGETLNVDESMGWKKRLIDMSPKFQYLSKEIPQLGFGINAAANIYEENLSTGSFHIKKSLLIGAQLLGSTAYDIVESLWMHDSSFKPLADTLPIVDAVGLFITGADHALSEKAQKVIKEIIRKAKIASGIEELPALDNKDNYKIFESDKADIISIADEVILALKNKHLNPKNKKELDKLINLKNHLKSGSKAKNFINSAGMSFFNFAVRLGTSIWAAVSDSETAFYVKLASSSAISLTKSFSELIGKKPATQDFIIVSEMSYLSLKLILDNVYPAWEIEEFDEKYV